MCVEKSKVVITEKKKRPPNKFKKFFVEFLWQIFFYLISLALTLKEKLVELVLSWYLGDRSSNCPPLNDENHFLAASAVELATKIRKRQLTSFELVNACIKRMNEVTPVLNAIIDGPFQEALEEAKRIDDRIANGQVSEDEFSEKPFLGVPFTTKDSTAVAGKLHTLGLVSRKTTRAKEDAECVALMKNAGGIILATTNVPEVNRWQETRNNLMGQTNNPYDTRRTTGGSSGGEAALIASCASVIGLGTDIGGSIRMPAFYCGIFGHKPTTGSINMRGCTFRTGKEQSTMVAAGPMTKHARDLLPLMKVLIEPRQRNVLKLDEPVNVRKLKYYYIRDSGNIKCTPVTGEMQAAMTKVVKHFESVAETKPVEIKLHGTEYASKLWRYWMTQESGDFNTMLGNGKRLNPFVELAKKLVGQSEFSLAAIFCLIDEALPKENADKIKEITRKLDEELTNILGDDGVLLYHSMTRTAPFHYALLANVTDFSYWSIMNVLHVPTTQIPLGLDSKGLPLGIQAVAARNRDRHCLAVAEELERAFGGWTAFGGWIERIETAISAIISIRKQLAEQ